MLCHPQMVPLLLWDKVQAELKRMEDMGVTFKVTQPTPWCADMVVAPKAQPGKIRLCVDLTHLNKWMRREAHPPSSRSNTSQVGWGESFYEAGYNLWQIPLSEESQHYMGNRWKV